MRKKPCSLTPERRAAWEAVTAKLARGEEVSLEEHSALLQDDMLGVHNIDADEEAQLFLTYWFRHHNADPIPWLGPSIAHRWYLLRERDRRCGLNRAEMALRNYIAANDYDHAIALNEIAARLHQDRDPFPDALADWAGEVHRRICDGTFKPPAKEPGNHGQPPYANEDRNGLYASADDWLEHYGMAKSEDRINAISEYTGDSDDVVRKGLGRSRSQHWRRAPWPGIPTNR